MMMSEERKRMLKKMIYWLILGGFVYLVTKNLADLEQILTVVREGDPLLIMFAVLLQAFSTFFFVQSLRSTLSIVGSNSRFLKVLKEYLSFNFVSVVTPFGTSGALLYFAKKISERTYMGIPGSLLILYVPFIITALIYSLHNTIAIIILELEGFRGVTPIVIATIILIVQQLLFLSILAISTKRPIQLKKIIFDIRDLLGSLGGRFAHGFLTESDIKITEWLDDFNLSSHILSENIEKKDLFMTIINASISIICQFLLLNILFIAFGVEVELWQVFVGHSVIYLFTVISPTPSGIGIVEGIAQLLFVGIGVPRDAAVVITFAYRGITIWLPMFIGFFAFRMENKEGL